MGRIAARLLLIVMLAAPAVAEAATCTVTDMRVTVTSFGLDGRLNVPGLTFPVTIDEQTGAFSMDMSGFPTTPFNIIIDNQLHFPASAIFAGTIDAAGNITIPDVEMDLQTDADPLTPIVLTPTLSTGMRAIVISGKDYATVGTPLDFASGTFTLMGEGIVVNAPNANWNVSAGLKIQCTLSPIPTASALPKAPALAKAGGKGKLGATPGPTDTTIVGDSLNLHATFTQGAEAADPATADVFVLIRDTAGAQVALLRVPSGTFTVKGKTLSVTDSDGSKLHVVTGRKTNAGGKTAPLSGALKLKRTKTGYKVTLTETGLDLSTLAAGIGSVTVGVGTFRATDAVAVTVKKSKVTLK
jgi:hypothetical protein